ncbi:MAG: UvrD-helicase domain-containing protein, partial [Rhodospirillaceae bacterium]|nr:UvrD-helicase domain-containing protein [Rhodospirillaceae bacterium]
MSAPSRFGDAVAIANRAQGTAIAPDASVWVTASAGSGKTKVLTDRVLALLLAGTSPQRILCLTFTKAAAAEMSNRIAERLAAWVTADEDALHKDLSPLVQGALDTAARAERDRILNRARRLFAEMLDAPGG